MQKALFHPWELRVLQAASSHVAVVDIDLLVFIILVLLLSWVVHLLVFIMYGLGLGDSQFLKTAAVSRYAILLPASCRCYTNPAYMYIYICTNGTTGYMWGYSTGNCRAGGAPLQCVLALKYLVV